MDAIAPGVFIRTHIVAVWKHVGCSFWAVEQPCNAMAIVKLMAATFIITDSPCVGALRSITALSPIGGGLSRHRAAEASNRMLRELKRLYREGSPRTLVCRLMLRWLSSSQCRRAVCDMG